MGAWAWGAAGAAAGWTLRRAAPIWSNATGNLNAGWTVLWYDPNLIQPTQLDLIKKAAGVLHKDSRYSLFVATAWDDSYGKLPLIARPAGR